MKPSDPPVVIEQEFSVPIARLWHAVTNLTEMQTWFFPQITEFEPREGFNTHFTIVHDEKEYTHQWHVAEVLQEKRLVFDWSYEGLPGLGKVVFEMSSLEGGCALVLTNSVVEQFPQDDPAFERESCEAGWSFLIHECLLEHLTETQGDE